MVGVLPRPARVGPSPNVTRRRALRLGVLPGRAPSTGGPGLAATRRSRRRLTTAARNLIEHPRPQRQPMHCRRPFRRCPAASRCLACPPRAKLRSVPGSSRSRSTATRSHLVRIPLGAPRLTCRFPSDCTDTAFSWNEPWYERPYGRIHAPLLTAAHVGSSRRCRPAGSARPSTRAWIH